MARREEMLSTKKLTGKLAAFSQFTLGMAKGLPAKYHVFQDDKIDSILGPFESLDEAERELENYIKEHGIKPKSPPGRSLGG